VRNRRIDIRTLNATKNSKYLSKCRENIYAPFGITGLVPLCCQLPLVFWSLSIFIGRGSSGYGNLFYGIVHGPKLGKHSSWHSGIPIICVKYTALPGM
jgi:hypothetical protein